MNTPLRQVLVWGALAVLLLVADQYTKQLASQTLRYGEQVYVTPFLNWTLLHNTGAAFSFLADAGGWQNTLFSVIAILVSLFIVYWLATTPRSAPWQALALTLVLSGALGNLYDRLTLGYVVDFVQFHYRQYYWPAFNIADSAITVGAGLLIIQSLFGKEISVDTNPADGES
ncbi:MAG TPA: signal peptidase II [Porticoccaceae bacterium]|nr:signal peptidase II [Porticoccaceae bacterium]